MDTFSSTRNSGQCFGYGEKAAGGDQRGDLY